MTQALVDMIENQRSYEVQANLLKEARTMDESSASLMRLPS
jgi:flagellar basal-body rod protein FlgF